jgi:hypothetical protein
MGGWVGAGSGIVGGEGTGAFWGRATSMRLAEAEVPAASAWASMNVGMLALSSLQVVVGLFVTMSAITCSSRATSTCSAGGGWVGVG